MFEPQEVRSVKAHFQDIRKQREPTMIEKLSENFLVSGDSLDVRVEALGHQAVLIASMYGSSWK